MKISKIILISFFSLLALFLLSLMIETSPEKRVAQAKKEGRTIETKTVEFEAFS